MPPTLKRTYGSRQTKTALNPMPSSPISTLSSSPVKPKRLRDSDDEEQKEEKSPQPKRRKSMAPLFNKSNLAVLPSAGAKSKLKSKTTKKAPAKAMSQLHFITTKTTLVTCSVCDLSYTKGAPDDELLHKSHCKRVKSGLEWGKDEDREVGMSDGHKGGALEIETEARTRNGKRGRIICVRADASGKIGSKVTALLDSINLTLSSPPLTAMMLQASKAYLFLLPVSTSAKEQIVGCVIAQRIESAMAIASPEDYSSPTASLVSVDATASVFCHPAPLPTPLGISRVFVAKTHRREGVATTILDTVVKTFVHGCTLSPEQGQVAFTQPTGEGSALMRRWGKGGVRIYEE